MKELIQKLNENQKEAVIHNQGPLLIVAGAGTGKTTVVTQRISHLITTGLCGPEEVLALTFTEKAAGEMEERVDRILPYGYVDLWISTFHSFAERILKEHGLEIGLPNDFKLLSPTNQWMLVRQNLDKFNLDYYRPLGNPTKFIHALISHFSRVKDEEISPEDYLKYVEELKMNSNSAEFIRTIIADEDAKNLSKAELKEILSSEIKKHEEVANAYHIYQQLLLDNNALDFGDLINYCLKLFKTRKNILAKYRRQFKYLLVDEFQDMNFAQYELVKLLAHPNNNITVVGDDDQSIYRFRGASISNILQFKDDYPKSKEIFLNTNYRSQQNILDLSYNFIQQNNPYRLEVKLSDGKSGKLNKKLNSEISGKAEIEHIHADDLSSEVKLTIQKIIELYNKNKETNWSDFAILVRANSSANDFIYGLEKANIPYNFVASKGLYSKKIVLDILAYLKLLDDYHEGVAMYRILALPEFKLNEKEIINLNYWAKRKGWSLFETIKQLDTTAGSSPELIKKIEKITNLIETHTKLSNGGKKTTEIIQLFLEESGYLKNITKEDSTSNREQIGYLNQFYKKVQNFEQDTGEKYVKDFLDSIEMELEAGEEGSLRQNTEDEGPDSVKVMTIHAAKGLEFKYIFLVNMVDKRFPTTRRGEPIEVPDKLVKEIIPEGDIHLQEERRLFYVAMTRAKEGLYFTSADDYGGARKKKISKFLNELETGGFKLSEKIKTQEGKNGLEIHPKRESTKDEVYNSVPKRFSFTQLRAFESCPYQYRFAHVLKIPIKGKPQFSFGRTMHLTLQKLFQLINSKKDANNIKVGWEEVYKIYQDSFIDDWYPDRKTKDEYFAKGKKVLKKFYEDHKDNWPQVKFLEYPFNLKIKDDEVYTFYGVIDRIDNSSGGVKIIDYKTGNSKNKLTADDKEQLLIYQMAAQEVIGEKVEELSFYYIEDNKKMNFLGQEKELEKLKIKIIKIIEEIKKGEFPPKPGQMCHYCDFNSICEYRKK